MRMIAFEFLTLQYIEIEEVSIYLSSLLKWKFEAKSLLLKVVGYREGYFNWNVQEKKIIFLLFCSIGISIQLSQYVLKPKINDNKII